MSVVICTRDRPRQIGRAVRAALRAEYPTLDVTVVDQSSDDGTESALAGMRADRRLRYLRSPTRGLARARNIGIRRSSGELVVLVDDDCEPRPDWIGEMVDVLQRDERIGLVFGNVVPIAHDETAGFVPAYVRSEAAVARKLSEAVLVGGMGACMAVRREAWRSLGGFDEMFGAGADLQAADEADLAFRALVAGRRVAATPSAVAVHHGFRDWRAGERVIRGYWYGTGAALAKQLRRRKRSFLPLVLRLAGGWLTSRSGVAQSLGRAHRWLRLASFARGVLTGIRTAVDPATGHYVMRRAREPGTARLGSHTHA